MARGMEWVTGEVTRIPNLKAEKNVKRLPSVCLARDGNLKMTYSLDAAFTKTLNDSEFKNTSVACLLDGRATTIEQVGLRRIEQCTNSQQVR